jgi:hypothetical protein
MGTVNDWVGAIGGTILAIELVVLCLILLLITAALAYGLWWVLKKMNLVHEKVSWATALLQKYTDKAAAIVAAPVIRTTSVWRGLKAGIYRATHWPRRQRVIVATAPSQTGPEAEKKATRAA